MNISGNMWHDRNINKFPRSLADYVITDYFVRPITPDDDFELIERLFYRTHFESKQEWIGKHKISYRRDNWKQLLFPDSTDSKPIVLTRLSLRGFIAEKDGVISAFATIGISPHSHNDYFDYGINYDCGYMLKSLLECCGTIVKEAGGTRIYQITGMPLGQIRNNQITLWESHGFYYNQFYHVFVDNRNIDSWKPSENLDLSKIQVPSKIEIEEISTILEEDVFLCLYDNEKEKESHTTKCGQRKGHFLRRHSESILDRIMMFPEKKYAN
jgi:hypothetical protein